jgi:SnoaL-like domain
VTEPSELLRLLADEREIRRVVLRYCRGIDRLDAALVRSCYHSDATDEHGSFQGGVDAYVTWVFELLAGYDSTFHLVANQLIDLTDTGDEALSETYGVAHHRGAAPSRDGGFDPTRNLTTGFRLVDRFERRNGEWRIAARVATTEWSRIDDEAGRWPVPDRLRHGTRDATDPVWTLVPEVAGLVAAPPPAPATGPGGG